MARWIRRLGIGAAAAVAIGLAALAGGIAFLHAAPGERWLVKTITEAAASDEQTLEIDGLQVSWWFQITAEQVRVLDRRGVWLSVDAPELVWHPFRLVRGLLDVERVAVKRIHVIRRSGAPAARDEEPPLPFDVLLRKVFSFPLRVSVKQVSLPIVLEEPVMPPGLPRQEVDFSGTFQMRRGGGAADLHLRVLEGETLRLWGSVAPDHVDVLWQANVTDLARWSRLAGVRLAGGLSGSGVVAGRLPTPLISGTLALTDGGVETLHWKHLSLTAQSTPQGAGQPLPEGKANPFRLALTTEITEPVWDNIPLSSLPIRGGVLAEIFTDTGRIRLAHARVDSSALGLSLTGVLEDWGKRSFLRLGLKVPQLEALPLADQASVKGAVDLRVLVTGDLLQPRIRSAVQLSTRGIATGIEAADGILGERPTFAGVLRLASGALRLPEARLIAKGGKVWLQGGLDRQRIVLRTKAEVPALAVAVPSMGGSAVLWSKVSGTPERFSATGLVSVMDVAVADAPPGRGALSFDLQDLPTHPQGMVALGGEVAGQPLEGRVRVSLVDGTLALRDLLLASGDSKISGFLDVGQGGAVQGEITGRIPDLHQWEKVLGLPLSGKLETEVKVGAAATPGGLTLKASVRGDKIVASGVSVRTLTLTANGDTFPLGGQMILETQGLSNGMLSFSTLRAEASGQQGETLACQFQAQGNGPNGAALDVAGRCLDTVLPDWGIGLQRLKVAHGGLGVSLTRPTEVRGGPDRLALAPTTLALADGTLTLQGSRTGEQLAAQVTLSKIPLGLAALVKPDLKLGGRLEGRVEMDGTLKAPRARVSLKGTGLESAPTALLGRMGLSLNADWDKGRVQAETNLEAGALLRLSAKGGFPLTLEESGPLPPNGKIEASLSATGNLARLGETAILRGQTLKGMLGVTAQVSGTVAQPRVRGEANLTGGDYRHLEMGTLLTGLTAKVSGEGGLQGGSARLSARATDGKSGNVRVEGTFTLAGSAPPSGWVEATLENFTALRRDDVEASLAGRVRVAPETGISGRIAIPRAEINIARFKGGGPTPLNVVEINKPGVPKKTESPSAAGPGVDLPLAVVVAIEHAFVRGKGVDTEWQGEIKASGSTAHPVLVGDIGVKHGQVEVLGQTFRFTPESKVQLQGGEEINPALALAAEAEAKTITARIEISGTAKSPDLALTSRPAKPSDEVLAHLLFGQESSKLSVTQQLQLAQIAAAGLFGGGDGGALDPVGGARAALGLDTLGVGSTGKGDGTVGSDVGVSAGKYITPDTFVRVDQGTQGLGTVTVEQDLGAGFSIQTEVGDRSGGGMGIQWKKDY